MGCEFCQGEFEWTNIKHYDNWTLQLYTNQYYLGRCLIKLDRHVVDFFDIEREEAEELRQVIVPELKSALKGEFDPDLFNYASLGNDCRHLHLHVIPRYRSTRKFNGKQFKDENWNSHYQPGEGEVRLDDQKFQDLKDTIGGNL